MVVLGATWPRPCWSCMVTAGGWVWLSGTPQPAVSSSVQAMITRYHTSQAQNTPGIIKTSSWNEINCFWSTDILKSVLSRERLHYISDWNHLTAVPKPTLPDVSDPDLEPGDWRAGENDRLPHGRHPEHVLQYRRQPAGHQLQRQDAASHWASLRTSPSGETSVKLYVWQKQLNLHRVVRLSQR